MFGQHGGSVGGGGGGGGAGSGAAALLVEADDVDVSNYGRESSERVLGNWKTR
jgi:hypothetical protein